ncbi:unnamed protein product, partial [Amoebophrya sp. A25]
GNLVVVQDDDEDHVDEQIADTSRTRTRDDRAGSHDDLDDLLEMQENAFLEEDGIQKRSRSGQSGDIDAALQPLHRPPGKLHQSAGSSNASPAHDLTLLTWEDILLHGRGAVGETALHICFLLNSDAHKILIDVLVKQFGKRLCRQ